MTACRDDAAAARVVQAVNVVTYFLPPHTTTLRNDEPQPLTCAIP